MLFTVTCPTCCRRARPLPRTQSVGAAALRDHSVPEGHGHPRGTPCPAAPARLDELETGSLSAAHVQRARRPRAVAHLGPCAQ